MIKDWINKQPDLIKFNLKIVPIWFIICYIAISFIVLNPLFFMWTDYMRFCLILATSSATAFNNLWWWDKKKDEERELKYQEKMRK